MSFTGNGITSCYPDEVENFISITVLCGEWLFHAVYRDGLKPGFVDARTIHAEINRIYSRAGMTFYSIFQGREGRPETENVRLGGTSGAGVWQQRLTKQGWQKLHSSFAQQLTPEDLGEPVLAGIVFYQDRRNRIRGYRAQVLAQRLDREMVARLADDLENEEPVEELPELA